MVWGNCLGVIVFTVAVVWGALYFLDDYTLHGQSVEVPVLVGVDSEKAISLLQQQGLVGEVTDTGYVDFQPAGVVLEQNIQAGTQVKSGRVVYLVVNAGQARKVALPDGIAGNCSMREAELRLKAKGLRVGTPEYIKGEHNWVYEIKLGGKAIQAGTLVSVKTPLTLVVGNGDVDEEYTGSDTIFGGEWYQDSTATEVEASDAEEALFE